jgi:hypothetical protein
VSRQIRVAKATYDDHRVRIVAIGAPLAIQLTMA